MCTQNAVLPIAKINLSARSAYVTGSKDDGDVSVLSEVKRPFQKGKRH